MKEFFFIFSILFTIIGLPIYMVGCDDTLGGYCYGFVKCKSKVIGNECYLTSGTVYHDRSHDDDTVGFNCNVHVQYVNNGYNETHSVYRSDTDDCHDLITEWKQVRKCNRLNLKDYPIGSWHTFYRNNVDGRFETHHLVRKYATIGFSFLMVACAFLILYLILFIVYDAHRYIEVPNPIQISSKV